MAPTLTITIPPEAQGLLIVASVSGGKDSTALILALLEAVDRGEIPRHLLRFAFADTGWEAGETYAYLDYLRARLTIDIVVVRDPLGMIGLARRKAGFPHRQGRWCTEKLKIDPLRRLHESLREESDTVNAVGVRAQESAKRATMPAWEDDEEFGGYVWRPLLQWTVEDVLRIHSRHGVKVNPLYRRGHDRVGCYPCIYATKEEIRLVAEHDPDRIALIDDEERWQTNERARRNAAGEGNFKHPLSTFFSARTKEGQATIHDVVAWSKTSDGGRQLVMAPAPRGGCMRWGMCDVPDETGDE